VFPKSKQAQAEALPAPPAVQSTFDPSSQFSDQPGSAAAAAIVPERDAFDRFDGYGAQFAEPAYAPEQQQPQHAAAPQANEFQPQFAEAPMDMYSQSLGEPADVYQGMTDPFAAPPSTKGFAPAVDASSFQPLAWGQSQQMQQPQQQPASDEYLVREVQSLQSRLSEANATIERLRKEIKDHVCPVGGQDTDRLEDALRQREADVKRLVAELAVLQYSQFKNAEVDQGSQAGKAGSSVWGFLEVATSAGVFALAAVTPPHLIEEAIATATKTFSQVMG